MEVEEDDELFLTEDEVAAEAEDEPEMMEHAGYWDNFLALVESTQKPWAQGEADTDEYRQQRAVEAFNLGPTHPKSRPNSLML